MNFKIHSGTYILTGVSSNLKVYPMLFATLYTQPQKFICKNKTHSLTLKSVSN